MTDERNQRLFSYGTLQLAEVQMAQFKRLLDGEDDAMPGFAQAMVEITDPEVLRKSGRRFHPIVSETGNPADSVAGKVFAVTADELAAADAYEVADYKRVPVTLASGRNAWVYVRAEALPLPTHRTAHLPLDGGGWEGVLGAPISGPNVPHP